MTRSNNTIVFTCLVSLSSLVLAGAMSVALGAGAAGAFCNSDTLWQALQAAGQDTGDRLWRMPLWQMYSKQVTGELLHATLAAVCHSGSCMPLWQLYAKQVTGELHYMILWQLHATIATV